MMTKGRTIVAHIDHDPREGVYEPVLRVMWTGDSVRQARTWLREEAPDGRYSILNQIETNIPVVVEKVEARILGVGQQYIQRTRKETTK